MLELEPVVHLISSHLISSHVILVAQTKMTQEEYINSVRGINDGSDLPLDLLLEIYSDITSSEIQIPEGDTSTSITDANWRFMMQQNKTLCDAPMLTRHLDPQAIRVLGSLEMPESVEDGAAFDRDIFLVVCRSVLAALAVVFETADPYDDHLIQKILNGFTNCATIAAHLQLTELFDSAIVRMHTSHLSSADSR